MLIPLLICGPICYICIITYSSYAHVFYFWGMLAVGTQRYCGKVKGKGCITPVFMVLQIGMVEPNLIKLVTLSFNFFFIFFIWEGERNTDLFLYLLVHSLFDSCALTRDWTYHLAIWGRHSNQLSYSARATYSFLKSITLPDESHNCLSLNALELVTPSVTAVMHWHGHSGNTNAFLTPKNAPQVRNILKIKLWK